MSGFVPNFAGVESDPAGEQDCHDRPDVAVEAGFDDLHALEEMRGCCARGTGVDTPL